MNWTRPEEIFWSVTNGINTFTAIAQDAYNNRKDTNSVTVNLPSTFTCVFDTNGNLTSDGTRGFDYVLRTFLTS